MPVSVVSRFTTQSPVYIFDLDGTILTANSFPLWVRYLLRGGPVRSPVVRARIAVVTAVALAKRKCGFSNHAMFKARLQSLWTNVGCDSEAADLVAQLENLVRPELRPLLERVADATLDAVLATAAADAYALPLGRKLGFRHIVASSIGRDNSGERKKEAVLDLLAGLGWRDRELVLFTDHRDDEPLMRICGTVEWFGTAERPVRI